MNRQWEVIMTLGMILQFLVNLVLVSLIKLEKTPIVLFPICLIRLF